MDADERRAWGPLIREARKAQGLDQEDLAEMAGTTRRTIGSIERGDTTAQTDVLRRILTALGLTETLELDPDVKNFVAMIGPLLQRLGADERARLMPAIVRLVADALQNKPTRLVISTAGSGKTQSILAIVRAATAGGDLDLAVAAEDEPIEAEQLTRNEP